jgi:hypothetical protein
MDKVVQRVAASGEETSSTAAEMSSQASGLKTIVGELTALVTGAGSQAQPLKALAAPAPRSPERLTDLHTVGPDRILPGPKEDEPADF